MKYDLSHLTQNTTKVRGPIQDDEALFLYALIRVIGIKYIVEIGSLEGYSTQNFLKAINGEGKVISIDPAFNNLYNIQDKNFCHINNYCEKVSIKNLAIPRIDLLFFDCHQLIPQIDFLQRCIQNELVNDNTIIVLHDTDIKPVRNIKKIDRSMVRYVNNNRKTRGNTGVYPIKDALTERIMVNELMDMGYVPLHAHANYHDCPKYIENYRHGITILSKPYRLLL